MTAPNLAHLRKDYSRASLDASSSPEQPLSLFEQWLNDAIAAQLPEPSAMTVATATLNGAPSTRVMLLKGVDAQGLVWFTNYDSRKGQELAANPQAALQFHWVELERVVRIEGSVSRVSAAESDRYFASRPLASRIGAWASPQSQVMSSRAELMARAAKVSAQYLLQPPRPPHWGGYRLRPQVWEFWQGRPSRLHDRLRYRAEPGQPGQPDDASEAQHWRKERLAP